MLQREDSEREREREGEGGRSFQKPTIKRGKGKTCSNTWNVYEMISHVVSEVSGRGGRTSTTTRCGVLPVMMRWCLFESHHISLTNPLLEEYDLAPIYTEKKSRCHYVQQSFPLPSHRQHSFAAFSNVRPHPF